MNADNDVDTTDQLDDGALTRGPGPTYTVNAKPGVGFTSPHPWSYDAPADVPGVWRVPGSGL